MKLRPLQRVAWDSLKRFNVLVCHRRWGKTYFCILYLIAQALGNKRQHPHPQYAYIAPTFTQAKRIAFQYIVEFCSKIPGTEINRSELKVTFANGAVIMLLGSEQADYLRGLWLDGCVIDESALTSTEAWSLVLRPTLADFEGFAIFIGTAMGRMNLLYERWDYAPKDEDWHRALYTVEDSDVISPKELKALKKEMRPSEWDQEMMCSWDASILGAYYRTEMADLVKNRLTSVVYDKTQPVYAALDLGYGDLTVWVIFQKAGNEIHVIDCQVFEQSSIPDQHRIIRAMEHAPLTLLLPHDADQHELGTGKTRKQVFQSLGYICHVVPRHGIEDGIDMVRDLLPRVWMDQEKCKVLVEALMMYRTSFDDVKRVFHKAPLHDWSSHYADAVRYMAAGEGLTGTWAPLDYRRLDRHAV